MTPLRRSLLRALQGFILALGAPLGWLAILAVSGADPVAHLMAAPGLYPEQLYQAADRAMYAAKQRGRNQTVSVTTLEAIKPPTEEKQESRWANRA